MNRSRVLLTILDGFGISEREEGNAVKQANTPNYDALIKEYPFTQIHADGMSVGLPEGQMGNSEVGHLNIGAGRIVYQELTRINKSIDDGDFFENETLLNAMKHAKDSDSAIHFMGLVSPGGVHSSMKHMYALLDMAKKNGLEKVYLHAFLDGRDTPPTSASGYLKEVEEKLSEIGLPKVATVVGRYYAMDRDNRWERVQQAYDALTIGKGEKAELSYEAVEKSYENGINDEFVKPTILLEEGRMKDNDAIVFFNFRPDRARQLTRAINMPDFDGFKREKVLQNIAYVCLTQYDETFHLPVAFMPKHMNEIFADILDRNGIRQFRTAETEKYAHVTFFFNGGVEDPYKLETRVLVPSPKVATYDLQPEMSAYEVTEQVVKALNDPQYGVIIVNYANPDMVGHTGVFDAAVKAVETVDKCVGMVVEAAKKNDVTMILTADHGNAECMIDPDTGKVHTAHTTNPVPFVLINSKEPHKLAEGGKLADIIPTMLDLLDIKVPGEMDGKSLLVKQTSAVGK